MNNTRRPETDPQGQALARSRVLVWGTVQGVNFRDSCRRGAVALGVTGWVRNRAEGTVEAVFEGEPARVRQLVDWAHDGPSAAIVERVAVFTEEPEGLVDFTIRATPH